MISYHWTTADDEEFIGLVKELDAYLKISDGDEHDFYNQFNELHDIKHIIIAKNGGQSVGCGAIKFYQDGVFEVKRMYTQPGERGRGVASGILMRLEKKAKELGGLKCILETGKKQKDAVYLYEKNQYSIIPNYGQYADMDSSVCFEKVLL